MGNIFTVCECLNHCCVIVLSVKTAGGVYVRAQDFASVCCDQHFIHPLSPAKNEAVGI